MPNISFAVNINFYGYINRIEGNDSSTYYYAYNIIFYETFTKILKRLFGIFSG